MELQGKRALITGITGTVGSRIAHRLLAEGMTVRALVRRPTIPEFTDSTVEWVQGDITNAESVRAAMDDVQVVIHAAAYIGADPDLSERTNIQGTQIMLDAALQVRPELFVHISTISVYDLYNETSFDETAPLCPDPKNPYQATKTEAERRVWQASEAGLPVLVIRPSNVLSIHPTSYWGPIALQKMAEGAVRWHPDGLFPWVHVENLVDLTLLAMRRPAAVGQAYTAVDGEVSNTDYWGRIAQLVGNAQAPDGVLRRWHFSAAKARKLGWQTRVTYEEAMVELEAYARANGYPQ
ncbi:MAG TPA: NAD-dependent epimerase/dehydratase family protein [Symbiobacteriaceae bacterium]|nr:NAD-dependent epimerase/dehydratase family protein [Symbiobacteriaceae bacterium]